MRTILEKYDLQHLDETDIGKMKKHQWKKIVKEKIAKHLQRKLKEQQQTHEKIRDLEHYGKKDYINEMPSRIASLALSYRLKMIGLNAYYRGSDGDVACPLCGCIREDYSHFTECSVLSQSEGLKIDDLYSNGTNRITRAEIIIEERLKQRERFLQSKSAAWS